MPKKFINPNVDRFHDYGVYIPTRTIWMGSEQADGDGESGVDSLMAESVIKNIHLLDSISDDPITILMNNIGGDEYHCFAIYDAIRCSRSEITIIVFGHAMSAGSIILQAADERIMSPNSRQMIHYGTWSMEGHAKTAQKWAKEGEKVDFWMEEMYLREIRKKKPKFTLGELRALLDHDTFLTAQESVDMGLADGVHIEKAKR